MVSKQCHQSAELLYPYHEGQLKTRQQQKYQRHLTKCRACLRLVRGYQAVSHLGSALPHEHLSHEQREILLKALPPVPKDLQNP